MKDLSIPIKLIVAAGWLFSSFAIAKLLNDNTTTQTGIALLILFAGLWMTEIFPLPVSALFVPVLGYLTHLMSASEAMAPFSSTIIYLFMGGFTLAALLRIHGIDRWLAQGVVTLTHGHLWYSITGFFLVTALLSMWMSNTSTTAMMLPIAMGLVSKAYPRMRTYVILGTAYCANVGGLATIVGSPPNGIASNALDLSFLAWFKVGLPTTVVLFPVVMALLWLVLKPEQNAQLADQKTENQPMQWTAQAKGSIALFLFTVICWVFAHPIGELLGVKQFDRMVAIGITALAPALGLISWKELERKIDWGVLLLFGGGLCLSAILKQTGTSEWLASSLLSSLQSGQQWMLVIASITLMIFLTELASNTGSAAILIPVLMATADQFSPAITHVLIFGVGVAATCAFMLPVATPPNALAYGTGEIKLNQMLKAGLLLNLVSIVVIYVMVNIFI